MIKKLTVITLISILASFCIGRTIIANAIDTGWYSAEGTHWKSIKSNTTGDIFNSYFVFNIPLVDFEITEAVLCLELTNYRSDDPFEDVLLSTVSTPIDILMADHSTSSGIYEDLMDGAEIGVMRIAKNVSVPLLPGERGPLLHCNLNTSGVNLVQNAAGGQFAIGLSLLQIGAEERLGFSSGYGDYTVRTHQLYLIPEPITLTLLAVGAVFTNRNNMKSRRTL